MATERWRQFRTNFGRVEGSVPDPRSGLITGDFVRRRLPGQPLLRREMQSLRPPPPVFLEEIFCLAGIIREPGDSGHDPGLDEKSKKREVMDASRTIYGRNFSHVLESRLGLVLGLFPLQMERL